MSRRGLVTDIGGTNARVAIVDGTAIETVRVYPTNSFGKATELFERFGSELGQPLPDRWAVAAAGIATEERIRGTNLGWDLIREELVCRFGLRSCILMNDFEAAAYGLCIVHKDRLIPIGTHEAKENRCKVLIGAGTGLGEATCVPCPDGRWMVLKSEGGHCSFAPADDVQTRLLRFLSRRYGHVSHERILSGPGLSDLYEFVCMDDKGMDEDGFTPKRPAEITQGAEDGDELCKRVLEIFCTIYGQEAGNLALKTLPEGGVYIGGGIAPHIRKWLEGGYFREGFESKGRMSKVLEKIPVFLVNEPYLGIYGGAYRLSQAGMSEAS